MKTIKYFTLTIIVSVVMSTGFAYAQKVGVAADKQKQENLEKNKKRQAEMKKKYNSMTPEQAAEAERKANEYKKTGGKSKTEGNTTKPSPGMSKPTTNSAVNKTQQNPKQGNVQKPGATKKVIWMESNGKPKVTTTPGTPGKPEAKPSGTNTQKPVVTKGKKESGVKTK
ncbi:MAG: hypothetical protein IPH45_02680 [Bacteroidales bacterium]|nr:hypothetical protein [Bacteroidales bacterium]